MYYYGELVGLAGQTVKLRWSLNGKQMQEAAVKVARARQPAWSMIANVRMARQTGSRAWLSMIAALSTGIALTVLCIEVDENPATRNHLWILVGMIVTSLASEIVRRWSRGGHMHLLGPDAGYDAETSAKVPVER